MRYFILAGEPSGDLHGAGLVAALKTTDPEAEIAAWGGDAMEGAGAQVLKHYRDLAFMGFWEVLVNIRTILRNFSLVKEQIRAFAPDALVLIDYPGFNLRMARWAFNEKIPVYYYISPQLWAWKENRIRVIRDYVDRMYVILPFEKAWYAERGVEVEYVGHPLLEAVDRYKAGAGAQFDEEPSTIALLPGSRRQEIAHMLPVMLQVAERRPDLSFVIARAPHIAREEYASYLAKSDARNVAVGTGTSYDCLSRAKAALTTSGTATLETALFGVPQVVCYKGSALSFEIARRLVKVPFISLVNLIAGKPVVEELIQENMNPERLTGSLDNITEEGLRTYIISEYDKLRARLDEGGASTLVARGIFQRLTTKTAAQRPGEAQE